jgi:hypothetical protein
MQGDSIVDTLAPYLFWIQSNLNNKIRASSPLSDCAILPDKTRKNNKHIQCASIFNKISRMHPHTLWHACCFLPTAQSFKMVHSGKTRREAASAQSAVSLRRSTHNVY